MTRHFNMRLPDLHLPRLPRRRDEFSFERGAAGAIAIGALAFGALAIGALAINRLFVKRARIGHLSVGTLEVDRLIVREEGEAEPAKE